MKSTVLAGKYSTFNSGMQQNLICSYKLNRKLYKYLAVF